MDRRAAGLAAVALLFAGCAQVFGIDPPNEVGGPDASRDSAAREAAGGSGGGEPDAAGDVASDSPSNVETGSSSGSDSGSSSGVDSGSSGGKDSGGKDSGSSSGVDSGSSSGSDGGCVAGTQQCAGTGVETCGANGQWCAPWPCATGTCTNGACTGSTTGAANKSCQTGDAGITNCGASSESCCTSLEVAGGSFHRTYTNTGSGPTGEADPATISGFRLDKYLVTVGRFRQFVNAWTAGYAPPDQSGKHAHLNGGQGLSTPGGYEPGWAASDNGSIGPTNANLACDATSATWTNAPGTNETWPIDCVTWWEAYAFCIWDGGFLPSYAEWDYAAAGGNQEREYPWGSMDPATNSQYAIYGCYYGSSSGACTSFLNMSPVGTATQGAGLWGQLDLVGEVWRWTLDSKAPGTAQYVNPCTDCTYRVASANRVIQGASLLDSRLALTFPHGPDEQPPTTRSFNIGFTCARTR